MATAHETILKTMEGFLHTDLEQLLEEHHHLLLSDFAALSSGPTKDKLEWISEIDSALGAAPHHTWHVGLDMQCGPGTAGAAGLVHRESMSWSWWMQRGVRDGGDVANCRDCISAFPTTTFPNSGWSRQSVPCFRLRPLLFFGGKERQTCLQFASSKWFAVISYNFSCQNGHRVYQAHTWESLI